MILFPKNSFKSCVTCRFGWQIGKIPANANSKRFGRRIGKILANGNSKKNCQPFETDNQKFETFNRQNDRKEITAFIRFVGNGTSNRDSTVVTP